MKVFVSHSSKDKLLVNALEELIRLSLCLPASEIRCSSVDGSRIPGGATTDETLRSEVNSSGSFVVVLSPQSISSHWVVYELGARWGAGKSILPLLAPQASPDILRDGPLANITALRCDDRAQLFQFVADLATQLSISAQQPAAYSRQVDLILALPRAEISVIPSERRNRGVVPIEELRASHERLSDEVFAIELLTQPVKIRRDLAGHVTVEIDRHGVREMVISNDGKKLVTEQYVTSQNIDELRVLDRKIHEFLADGPKDKEMPIDLPNLNIRLRWASGGVLSIITDANGKQWVPLFFRDIPPYGWNISLGTTERWFTKDGSVDKAYLLEAELTNPWQYSLREFLEETLVVTGIPHQGGSLNLKNFSFDGHIQLPGPSTRAKVFDDEHCRLRKEEDDLTINEEACHRTEVRVCSPDCSVRVLSESGAHAPETKGVLICFSLLDLGIEVVTVVKYQIDQGDWMLDGEIKEKHSAERGITEKELIRMPIAMLSLSYLREIFGGGQDWHRYTFGPLPSIKVARAPDAKREEIRLFDWDVRRRMEAIDGKWGTESQRKRFLDWHDKFGQNFIRGRDNPDDEWQPSDANPSRLFVPGTAKVLNLYFKMLEREGPR